MSVLTELTAWETSDPHDQITMKELVLKHCGSVYFTSFHSEIYQTSPLDGKSY